MATSEGLSAKHTKLIAYLLSEGSIEAACSKAGVTVQTYWRWMKDPAFLSEYRTARTGILENTIAKLQSLTFEAIDTLERNLHCENPSVEIRCATIILEQSMKGLEVLGMQERIERLEAEHRRIEEQDEQN